MRSEEELNLDELLINKLAEKYKLPKGMIKEVCHYPYGFVRDIMKKGDLESVLVPYWGKYYVTDKKKVQWKIYLDEKAKRDNSSILEVDNKERGEISSEETKNM